MELVEKSLSELSERCSVLEKERHLPQNTAEEVDPSATRFLVRAVGAGILSSLIKRCPSDYYDRDLEWRKEYLHAASCDHLCKSIVMENTKYSEDLKFAEDDMLYNRYYLIVIQYTRRMNPQNVLRHVRDVLNSGRNISSKHFNFRLAEKCEEITGFDHNAVSPIGLKRTIPILISDEILKLSPPCFWLGAGEVDLKWRVDTDEFMQAFKPSVVCATFPRDEAPL